MKKEEYYFHELPFTKDGYKWYLPPGEYYVKGVVNLPDNISIIGGHIKPKGKQT